MWTRIFIAVTLAFAAAPVGLAQTVQTGALPAVNDLANAPERVGRLAFVEGDVQAWNDQRRAWEAAVVNLPVTSRSAFWTGSGARAEITVGSAALRLDSRSQANLIRLDDGGTDIDVARGSMELRTGAAQDPSWQVAVRDSVIAFASPGLYRIDVDPAHGLLVATVFDGQADYSGGTETVALSPGQRVVVDLRSHQVTASSSVQRDAFDDWNSQRDREQDRLASWRYVSPEMTGVESLDSAGYWSEDPTYGALWYPNDTATGWQPYQNGNWVWQPPWGWTWVDSAPWGFAPFHYGSWVYLNSAWAWAPGARHRRPVFAPAMAGVMGPAGRIPAMPHGGQGYLPAGTVGHMPTLAPSPYRTMPSSVSPAYATRRFVPSAAGQRFIAPPGRNPGVAAMPSRRVWQYPSSPASHFAVQPGSRFVALPRQHVAAPQVYRTQPVYNPPVVYRTPQQVFVVAPQYGGSSASRSFSGWGGGGGIRGGAGGGGGGMRAGGGGGGGGGGHHR